MSDLHWSMTLARAIDGALHAQDAELSGLLDKAQKTGGQSDAERKRTVELFLPKVAIALLQKLSGGRSLAPEIHELIHNRMNLRK